MELRLIILLVVFFITILLRVVVERMSEEPEPTEQEMDQVIKTYFDKKIDYTCLPRPPKNESICKIDPKRTCKLNNESFCYIEGSDTINAWEYAYVNLCLDKGHCAAKHPDGNITCEFTKESCLNATYKKKELADDYFEDELKDENDQPLPPDEQKEKKESFYYNKHYWVDGVGCVDGSISGIANFENYCTTDHACSMGQWKFNPENFSCTIKPKYCENLGLKYKKTGSSVKDINGKNQDLYFCTQDTAGAIGEALIGKTLTRGTSCPPYANVWGKKKAKDHPKIKEEKCDIHLTEPNKPKF